MGRYILDGPETGGDHERHEKTPEEGAGSRTRHRLTFTPVGRQAPMTAFSLATPSPHHTQAPRF